MLALAALAFVPALALAFVLALALAFVLALALAFVPALALAFVLALFLAFVLSLALALEFVALVVVLAYRACPIALAFVVKKFRNNSEEVWPVVQSTEVKVHIPV